MVGVRQSLFCDVPCLVPTEMRLVEQNSHELRDRHGRVRIVELDGDLTGKRAPIEVSRAEPPHEISKRAGDEKILLHKAQTLPYRCMIVGIQHTGQRFGSERFGERADEITAIELLKIE